MQVQPVFSPVKKQQENIQVFLGGMDLRSKDYESDEKKMDYSGGILLN